MKKFISVFVLFLFCLAASAQKTIHDPNAEVRNVKGYHAIEVAGGIDLFLSNGDETVAVSAKDNNVRNRIKTEVKDGVLKIWMDGKDGINFSIRGDRALKAYVSFKTLDRLSASGGSDVAVDGTIKSNNLKLGISGGSDFKGKVNVTKLEVDQSGGSDVDISGTADEINLEASGGSDFDGYELITNNCTISASGGSDINITANKELSAEASGASDISWKGNATVKKAKASGAGSVSHRS